MPMTFLPLEDFELTAKVLDMKRLGKQRVEAWGILDSLMAGRDDFWTQTHAAKMWVGHEIWLARYGEIICLEWLSHGYNDSQLPRFQEALSKLPETPKPWWLGDQRLHSSHRATLLAKDQEFYSKWGWSEVPKKEYFWPHKEVPVGTIADRNDGGRPNLEAPAVRPEREDRRSGEAQERGDVAQPDSMPQPKKWTGRFSWTARS